MVWSILGHTRGVEMEMLRHYGNPSEREIPIYLHY